MSKLIVVAYAASIYTSIQSEDLIRARHVNEGMDELPELWPDIVAVCKT